MGGTLENMGDVGQLGEKLNILGTTGPWAKTTEKRRDGLNCNYHSVKDATRRL